MIKFYYSGAPNPMKVALMLEETGLPYEAIPVDTRKGEQHKPEYLAINPNAKVPAIVDGRTPIAVSNEEYIQPEKAVKHYGVGFMEAVRTLRFPKPRFAFGGLVQAHQAARFATGGAANAGSGAAGMSGMPSLSIQFVNQGTPQRMVSQQQTMNGKDMIVSVVLSDLSSGGPISKGINGAVARGR